MKLKIITIKLPWRKLCTSRLELWMMTHGTVMRWKSNVWSIESLRSVLPTFRFKLTGCAAKLLLGYVMFPYYVVQSSLSLWSIGCKIDIFCKWLPQRHSNLWQHQQRFFSSVLQRRRRRATFYVFISQSLLSAPPFSFQSKNWPSTLSSSLLAECSLLT